VSCAGAEIESKSKQPCADNDSNTSRPRKREKSKQTKEIETTLTTKRIPKTVCVIGGVFFSFFFVLRTLETNKMVAQNLRVFCAKVERKMRRKKE